MKNIQSLPTRWEFKKLGDLVNIQSGHSPSIYTLAETGKYPFIKVDDLNNSNKYQAESRFYTNDDNRYLVQVNSVVFPKRGAAILSNKVRLVARPLYMDTNLMALSVKSNEIGSEFLYYVLTHQKLYKLADTSTIPQINNKHIVPYQIMLPPFPEQQRIAEIIGTWDRAITLIEQLIAAKQQRKKGLMQRLLTGQMRFPGYVKSNERFNTKFGWLPVDWRLVPLQKLVKAISRLEKVQPGKEYRLIGVKWYVAGAHVHSILSGESIKTTSLSRVEENDIIYNKMWTTKAAFAIAKPEHSNTYGTTEYPQFRAKENLLRVDFLEYAFHLPRFQYDAITLCRGTTGRARLNPKDFLKLEVPLPSLTEQRQIAATLQACDTEINLLHQKLDTLQRQKKGLMQQLLTGLVRVKV